jgi:CheY-like chemotaxis protein/HPt (histidine-containing phosphotransfer) domain-containing protein
MGGQIGVESDGMTGSVFWFRIPMLVADRAQWIAQKPPEPKRLLEKMSGKRSGKILLAEDNEINQKFAKILLTRLGYEVTTANNGAEALDILAKQQFDVILMDCHMPELDGYEATISIRSKRVPGQENIPIIAVTANALPDERDKCIQIGMNDYLSKPISLQSLVGVLDRWLPPQPSSLIDRDALRKIVAIDDTGGVVILKEFIALFTSSFDDKAAKMEQAILENNGEVLFKEAHTLYPNCAYLGADAMAGLCRDIESFAHSGSYLEAKEKVVRLKELYRLAKAELDSLEYSEFEVKSA